jgi:hypothetical protein
VRIRLALLLVLVVAAGAACGEERSTRLILDLDGDLTTAATFFDSPLPSDLRLDPDGHPDFRGFPNPNDNDLITGLLSTVGDHPKWPVVPVAWLRFSGPLAPRAPDVNAPIPAEASAPALLVDVDPASPERGRLFPLVAEAGVRDDYRGDDLLALAARPGFVLAPERRYAFVVKRNWGDATGAPLGVARALADLAAGRTPAGRRGEAARALYAPLWETLATIGVRAEDVAAATVFTTGDVVADTSRVAGALAARYTVTLRDLAIDPDDGAAHERYCELVGKVTYPQFQHGAPPFNDEGLFDTADGGLPSKQRDEEAPFRITLPKGEMPAAGFPLVVYFHGSGGTSSNVVDRGPEANPKGFGPAHVFAGVGVATAASALPVNPERLRDAGETAYLNLSNLAAMRDTFRQGVVEQRLFLDALTRLTIPPSVVAGCPGVTLPAGASAFKLDTSRLIASGQSMGGMYTNMIAATDPRYRIAVPTGAGGFWSYFITETTLIADVDVLLGTIFGTAPPTFLYPYMHLFQLANEAADPMVYMPRLSRRPLDGHPVRPVYEPVGETDSYFPTTVYDAMVLAYGHEQAGPEVWPTMQPALALAGLDGILPYPIAQNLTSADGTRYTGVVVQYPTGGKLDGHQIYSQVDGVKTQYACFVSSFLRTGVATVIDPMGSCP